MPESVARRVALLTGGTGGIGSGVAMALTERGFDVVVSDLKIAGEAVEDMKIRAAPGAGLAFVQGNVADVDDHPRFVGTLFAFGRIDSLVNVGGVSAKSRGDLLDVTTDSYDFNFAVNTRGAFFLTQAVSRRMIEEDPQGVESARSIIFVTSSNATIAAPERGEYAMSKAAATTTTKLYAVRLAAHGIAVYEVRPGTDQDAYDRGRGGTLRQVVGRGVHTDQPGGTRRTSVGLSRAWPSVTCRSRQVPRSPSMVGCTSTTTEPTAPTRLGIG